MEKENIFCRRDFINKEFHHSDASIFSEVLLHLEKDGKSLWEDLTLKIRDCDKVVYLQISVEDESSFENSLFKIDTMVSHLQDLRTGLISAREKYKELEETVKKNKDKTDKE